MPAVALTGKQRRHLRGLGHNLTAVVQIGKEGLSETLVAAVDAALETHELIKVKIGQNALLDRKQVADELSKATSSEVAQVLGNTVLLYRRHPEEPTIKLPS